MTKSNTLYIGLGIVVLIILIAGILGFMKDSENVQDDPSLPDGTVSFFQDELTGRALARGPHPIEGFDAQMLIDIFPGLEGRDFDGVATGAGSEEGIHSYVNGELQWERTSDQPITSAERTVTLEGYEMLLENLSERLDMPVSSEEDITAVIDEVDIPSEVSSHISSMRDFIRVYVPRPLSAVTSPLTVWGEARGSWYFEASFQVLLVDENGDIVAESHATAQDDWMTEEFVPFEGTIEFSKETDTGTRGTLIFQKANPSGLSENADKLEIPVLFE